MNRLPLVLLLAAGCGSSSPGTTNPHNEGARPTAIGPAPTVTWAADGDDYGHFETAGLPAIAFDASRVIIAYEEQGAGLTPPNLTLRQIDRDDHEADRHVVLEFDPSGGEDAHPTPQQVDDSNAYLTSSNEQYGWTPLTTISPEPIDPDDESPMYLEGGAKVTSGSIVITFDQNGHITVLDAGQVVLDKTQTGWLAPSENAGTDVACDNPAYLEQASIDATHHAALVTIAYYGTDSCWEPSPQMHFVAW